MKTKIFSIAVFIAVSMTFAACTQIQGGTRNYQQEKEMTVGTVQREIKKGMSGAQVAETLGSPNIVTSDENGNETWVYDKIATEASYSESSNGLFLILYGQSSSSASASVTQKTLTVVIKFNQDKKVDTFTYHASKF
jgi:outer membrane protein assembly factor BamE (lipoprotein component of BamABCDE complex)